MLSKIFFNREPADLVHALDIVRITVALIILMHPLHGLYYFEDIVLFGGYLRSLGYPFGVALAWVVLLLQVACSLALLLKRLIVPACIGHSVVIIFGLWHFHRPHGWFVTGPGESGMEWGFILLGSLFGVLWAYWPRALATSMLTSGIKSDAHPPGVY